MLSRPRRVCSGREGASDRVDSTRQTARRIALVADFTSALYLGMRHPSASLAPWAALTTGRPAALAPHPGEGAVVARLAALTGGARALLGPSTLHLAWDLFALLAGARAGGAPGAVLADAGERTVPVLCVDVGAYPVARWGAERAAARGVPLRHFAHRSAAALAGVLADAGAGGGVFERGGVRIRPIVVTDGFCPGCGRAAPLAAYQRLVRPLGGLVVVDDTQALGVLGRGPAAGRPYGEGGGGTLRWSGAGWDSTIVLASLAKAFGAPVAALIGNAAIVERFATESETRVHCSPPSAAAIAAAEHALTRNARDGPARRDRLAALVAHFRAAMGRAGFATVESDFPVQAVPFPTLDRNRALALQAALRARGTAAVLQRAHRGAGGPPHLSHHRRAPRRGPRPRGERSRRGGRRSAPNQFLTGDRAARDVY